jgi:hypothetical protein
MSWAQVAVTGMNAFNQVQQGRNARAQAGLQAAQSDYQAQVEKESALKTAEIIRRAGRKQVGQAAATFAAAGVKVGDGSAGEVERDIAQGYEHDAFQALLEGGRRASAMQLDGELTRINGRMQEVAGKVNAAGTVLGGTYGAMRSNGWRSAGAGFSGQQRPAPVEDRSTYVRNAD